MTTEVKKEDPTEVPKNKKKAYEKLAKLMRGRLESDIPPGDDYWQVLGTIRKMDAAKEFTEPDAVPKA